MWLAAYGLWLTIITVLSFRGLLPGWAAAVFVLIPPMLWMLSAMAVIGSLIAGLFAIAWALAQRNISSLRNAKKERWAERFGELGLGDEIQVATSGQPSPIIRAFAPVDRAPKYLYKFRDWSNPYHKLLITQRQMYIPSPTEFNDPFDCRLPVRFDLMKPAEYQRFVEEHVALLGAQEQDDASFAVDNPYTFRNMTRERLLAVIGDRLKVAQDAREIFSPDQLSMFGVLCLSEEQDNVLLWSHYAKAHQGFGVGVCSKTLREFMSDNSHEFEYRLLGFNAVQYVDQLPVLEPGKSEIPLGVSLFFNKASAWAYEKEWRILVHYFDEPKRALALPAECIREIHLGCNIPYSDREDILSLASETCPSANIIEWSRAPLSYRLSRR
jgi:hypothetical protein